MRKCIICHKTKYFSEFTLNKTSHRTGRKYYKSFCKKCVYVYQAQAKGRHNSGQFKKGIIPWNKKETNGRNSIKAQQWALKVFKRDNFKCQECYTEHQLHAHHVKGWKKYPDLRFDINNGLTLCRSCHSRLHGKTLCNLLKNGSSWAKGRKFSLEYRKKLSDAHKAKNTEQPNVHKSW